ncbi:ribosomal protein S18-alanine N-acetyltransferase [Sneathiella marina]|uniref:Ribosomal protein S18-alanine N-acetyltransferase n=1 Tax=Sneathiella marina TaxID=2950108 RepID=A0ABY4W7G0_9PROT|nr:ribosomal protein S18-alanine N-acetyltransferase [Sneathiella marina]USG61204.1 ribosomal protein S18-alanine N-acetyltransferase [Sneathiella marina]
MSRPDLKIEFIETASHAGLAAALHQQCFAKPWDEASFISAMSIPGTVLVLASQENEPVALALYRYIGTEAEILTLGVLPDFRKRNIASTLLDRGGSYLNERQIETLWLDVGCRNHAALCLYKSQGFEEAGRRRNYYNESGNKEDAIVMRRRISSVEP